MHKQSIEEILTHRKNMHIKLVIQGILIGCITGLVIVLNRILIDKFSEVFYYSCYGWIFRSCR